MSDHWENGLCSGVCGGDSGTCMSSWFCSACLFGRVSSRQKSFPNNDSDMVNGSCCIFGLSVCLGIWWIPQMLRRQAVRNQLGIQGDGCNDCLVSAFCGVCSLSQMNMELKSRAEKRENYTMDGYPREQQNMVYEASAPPYEDSPRNKAV